jgi:hypothetical protein
MYLGVGSWLALRMWGSLWNSSSYASVTGRIYWKLTAGYLGIGTVGLISGWYLKKTVSAWIVKNTCIKEIIYDAVKVSFIAGWIYRKLVSTIVKQVTSFIKYADNQIIRIPYSTYVVTERGKPLSFTIPRPNMREILEN